MSKKRGISVPTLVKWAGGKRRLLEQFKELFPQKFNRYFEPFVGGGAVAFFILKYCRPSEAFLSDINEELINVYNVVKTRPEELIEHLGNLKQNYSKDSFLKLRAEDPKLLCELDRAGRFIFLNKTCFNGLYRVNSKGQFNVPFGKHTNPAILMKNDLLEISKLLASTNIQSGNFEDVLNDAKSGDFIYFDPPYDPLKKESFTKYASGDFLENEQRELAKVFKELDKRGCFVMLSNNNTPLIRELYKDYLSKSRIVKAARMINADATGRGKIDELVITNYLPLCVALDTN